MVPCGVKVTVWTCPVGSTVLSVTVVPSARPFTRLSKFICPPAKATSCGASCATCCDGSSPSGAVALLVVVVVVVCAAASAGASRAAEINRSLVMAILQRMNGVGVCDGGSGVPGGAGEGVGVCCVAGGVVKIGTLPPAPACPAGAAVTLPGDTPTIVGRFAAFT